MQRLNFSPGFIPIVVEGRKKITLRKWREGAYDFSQGETVIGVFRDGLNILLRITAETEVKLFSEMSDKEAQEDGFKNAKEAFRGLKTFYPDLKKTDTMATIRFEVLTIDGVPVVSANNS